MGSWLNPADIPYFGQASRSQLDAPVTGLATTHLAAAAQKTHKPAQIIWFALLVTRYLALT
jgi:hypothetical protein